MTTRLIAAMARRLGSGAVFAAGLLAACGPRMPPAPVIVPIEIEGPEVGLDSLAGWWTGEFRNALTGGIGTIELSLNADRGTVHGNVLLHRPVAPEACADPFWAPVEGRLSPRIVLTIGAVGLVGGRSGNRFQPYADPERSCLVGTWFEGTFRHDTLGGTFFSQLSDGDTLRMGEWWAVRTSLERGSS